MKFSRTFTNKLVSYADRYFTYDSRSMKRENSKEIFDFFAISRNNGTTTSVCISRSSYGLWVSIKKGDHYIIGDHLKSFKEVDTFKRMIRCLG